MDYRLTERELEILWTVAEHGGNQAAADLLDITLQTVKNHISRILVKTKSFTALQAYHRLATGYRFHAVTTHTYEEEKP